MKPIIGITCNYDYKDEVGIVSHMGAAGQRWNFLAEDYISAIEEAGGIPVMIPLSGNMENIKELTKCMDGILVSGGHDINPREYGQRAKAYCGTVMPMRDRQDLNLAGYILRETEKPLYGICRGIQVLNVAAGGTLYQDLKEEGGFEHHFCDIYPPQTASHSVKTEKGSRLRAIFGKEVVETNSFHHQAVRDLGHGFAAAARSEDGVIEAIELPGERFVMGTQWHPEMMAAPEQKKIFTAFVDACR